MNLMQKKQKKEKSWLKVLMDSLNSQNQIQHGKTQKEIPQSQLTSLKRKPKKTTLPLKSLQDGSRSPRKTARLSSTRKTILKAYKASYEEIPDKCACAACGLQLEKQKAERHHPAGRRKAAFCFTVMLHPHCHKRVHDDPAWATNRGLLWSGRNSKVLSIEDASNLVGLMPFPPNYAINILKKYQS